MKARGGGTKGESESNLDSTLTRHHPGTFPRSPWRNELSWGERMDTTTSICINMIIPKLSGPGLPETARDSDFLFYLSPPTILSSSPVSSP